MRRPKALEKLQYVQFLTSEVFPHVGSLIALWWCATETAGLYTISLVVFLQWLGMIRRDAVSNKRRFLR